MSSFDLVLNGESHTVKSRDIESLLSELGLLAQRVAVELNKQVVARELYKTTYLDSGDEIEIIQFVGGG